MAQKESTVTLKDWLEAPWFKLATRVFVIVGGASLPVAGALATATLVRVANVEAAVVSISDSQTELHQQIEDQDRIGGNFRAEVRSEIKDVKDGIQDAREDVAGLKGLLEGVLRSREASRPAASRFPLADVDDAPSALMLVR